MMTKAQMYERFLKAVIERVEEADEDIFKEAYEDIMEEFWENETDDDTEYDRCLRRQKDAIADLLEGIEGLRRAS